MTTAFNETQMDRYKPGYRRLRVHAVDPHTAKKMNRVVENELTLKVPWEDDLAPGPIGEYVEVVDFDPESDCFYPPVDLNSQIVLAQDGLPPSETDPRFHQQTVYALVMTTLSHFEQGLGRTVLWSPHLGKEDGQPEREFVQRLRVYPHALRGPSAYYSPSKKALLMGYTTDSFTCLSHGVIAHETIRAVLDGLGRFVDPWNSGSEELAVHEAIADTISLLQQFALPGFLASQLTFTSDLDRNERLLEELAKQLAQPVGIQADLRRSIGEPSAQKQSAEPHIVKLQERAALLVAALFEVFLSISRKRVARLLAVAGIGVNEQRELNRDLLEALSTDVARNASHLLRMCIRAIDYCPPVDLTFADFLRAIITADTDLTNEDESGYRVALINAFRRFGIFPSTIGATFPVDLMWKPAAVEISLEELEIQSYAVTDRQTEFASERERCAMLFEQWQSLGLTAAAISAMGLALDKTAPRTIDRTRDGLPRFSVDSFRLARRTGLQGEQLNDWVITLSQERRGYFDPTVQTAQDEGQKREPPDFIFRGGCTLIVDAATWQVRYCIAKSILSANRLARYRESLVKRISVSTVFEEERKKEHEEPLLAIRGGLASFPY